MAIIVKRKGHIERFDAKKVYGSVYSACASADYPEKECEQIADEMIKVVKKFLKEKKEIESSKIRQKIVVELKKRDKELAHYYEQFIPNLKKL